MPQNHTGVLDFTHKRTDMERINIEEQKCRFFTLHRERYPQMLYRYKHSEEYFPELEFSKLTAGDGETHAFKEYLRTYIKEFTPRQLCRQKKCYLMLKSDGHFAITQENGNPPSLNSGEKIVYQFLCYIYTAKFWRGFERMRDIHYRPKPLVIKDFSKEVGKKEYVELLNAASDAGDEIVLLK